MKNTSKVILLLSIIISAHASGSLKSECVLANLESKHVILENRNIEEYAIATVISDMTYGFKVRVDDKWFKVTLKEGDETQAYRDQFSSTARIAKILHLPVNICVDNADGGYLLGIELR